MISRPAIIVIPGLENNPPAIMSKPKNIAATARINDGFVKLHVEITLLYK